MIIVKDFETGSAEYEMYTYGEEIVVMPVSKAGKKPSWDLASREIEKEISHHVKGPFKVEMLTDSSAVIHVPEDEAARVIGKAGRNIDHIEKALGMHIDVRTGEDSALEAEEALAIAPRIEETAKHLIIWAEGHEGESVEVRVGKEPGFTATVGRRGDIRIAKSSAMAKKVIKRLKAGERLDVRKAAVD